MSKNAQCDGLAGAGRATRRDPSSTHRMSAGSRTRSRERAGVPRGGLIWVIVAIFALAGCSGSTKAAPAISSGPGSSSAQTDEATVDGTATGTDGQPVAGVAVGFQQRGCSSCRLYSAVTDSSGEYSTSMPPGSYVVVCQSADGSCTPGTSDGTTVEISSDTEVDLTIGGSGSAGDSADSPSDPPSESSGGSGSDSDLVLSGHVRDASGQPVAGASVEIEFVVSGNVHVSTDASGYYAIPSGPDVAIGTAVCEVLGLNNIDDDCEPVGVQTPVTIDPSQGPRVIDWVVSRA